MITVEERSMLAGLEAKRGALQRELSAVKRQIHQIELARIRIEERIKLLVKGPRQAA